MTETINHQKAADVGDVPELRFVWLEITGNCQLECVHCYADSGPNRTHGAMTQCRFL